MLHAENSHRPTTRLVGHEFAQKVGTVEINCRRKHGIAWHHVYEGLSVGGVREDVANAGVGAGGRVSLSEKGRQTR